MIQISLDTWYKRTCPSATFGSASILARVSRYGLRSVPSYTVCDVLFSTLSIPKFNFHDFHFLTCHHFHLIWHAAIRWQNLTTSLWLLNQHIEKIIFKAEKSNSCQQLQERKSKSQLVCPMLKTQILSSNTHLWH